MVKYLYEDVGLSLEGTTEILKLEYYLFGWFLEICSSNYQTAYFNTDSLAVIAYTD